MARYYKLAVQPCVRYIAGYGINRPGFPEEWTPCEREPTPEQWHAWACKAELSARRYYKAKNGTLVMRGSEWFWCVEELQHPRESALAQDAERGNFRAKP